MAKIKIGNFSTDYNSEHFNCTHGFASGPNKSKIYPVWQRMRQRCKCEAVPLTPARLCARVSGMRSRNFFLVLWIAICMSVGFGGGAIITSCSTSVQRKSVNTIASAGYTGDTAFRAYLDLVLQNQIPTNSVPQVSQAYATFQSAFRAALIIATVNSNSPPSVELVNSLSQLQLQISAAKKK